MQDWHTVFSTSEREAQRRWGNPSVWDEARIERLVWGEIPPRFHARLEAVPFFFLATSDCSGRATTHDDPVRLARFPHAKRAVQVRVEQVVPNCAAHVPRLVPVAAGAENGS